MAVAVPVLAVFAVPAAAVPVDSAPAAFASPEVFESPPASAGVLASAAAGGGGSAMAADLMGQAGGSRGQRPPILVFTQPMIVAGKDTAL